MDGRFHAAQKRSRTSSVDGSRVARAKYDALTLGRVQTSVRPIDADLKRTAGPDGVRELGPTLRFRLLRLGRSLGCGVRLQVAWVISGEALELQLCSLQPSPVMDYAAHKGQFDRNVKMETAILGPFACG